MAELTFTTLDKWGMDSFCIQDYEGYLKDNGLNIQTLQLSTLNLAGLVLFDTDTPYTIEAFLEMAKAAQASIILIEFCNLKDEMSQKLFPLYAKNYIRHNLKRYVDLESYETKLSYGLRRTKI